MATDHDMHYTWPFPRLNVVVRAVASQTATPALLAYVDTGADTTLVPLMYLQHIRAEAAYDARLRGYSGNARPVTVYLVDLEIAGHLLPGIEVVGDIYDDIPLLGRNVLNKLHVLIAGPEQQTVVLSPALATRTLKRTK
jgi:hypothetical protein